MSFAGIDPGSYNTVSYVAWLEDNQFFIDAYQATPEHILPVPPEFLSPVRAIAVDAPQGLPALDAEKPIRRCDQLANSPTRVLPLHRRDLQTWNLYCGLIEFGIDFFWKCHQTPGITIAGIELKNDPQVLVCETYPRMILRRMAGIAKIPSKRKSPVEYADMVTSFLKDLGFQFDILLRPTPDQCDAMLCALAASSLKDAIHLPENTVGLPPIADEKEQVIREGFIVCP